MYVDVFVINQAWTTWLTAHTAMYIYGKVVIGLSITTIPYMYIVYLTLCYHIPVSSFDMDYERVWNLYLKRVNGAQWCVAMKWLHVYTKWKKNSKREN